MIDYSLFNQNVLDPLFLALSEVLREFNVESDVQVPELMWLTEVLNLILLEHWHSLLGHHANILRPIE